MKQELWLLHRDQMSFINMACSSDHFHKANENRALQIRFRNCYLNAY